MPVQWTFAHDLIHLSGNQGINTAKNKKRQSNTIDPKDAMRQSHTASVILQKLNDQPGVILADEVGMGKTYVALAVVASVLNAERKSGRPIVIMVPPGLANKWRNEWMQFKTMCVQKNAFDWVREGQAKNPGEFFKLLDDPQVTRRHLIFITTSCFHQGFTDGWMKLAFIRGARAKTKMDEDMKKRIYRWATSLVRLKAKQISEDIIEKLLRAELEAWHQILIREDYMKESDDNPIPEQLIKHIDSLDFTEIIKVIRGDALPRRTSIAIDERITDVRKAFNDACDNVYKEWLQKTDWRAPLLVLDEAHHAKNDGTRLAGLFRTRETMELLDGGTLQSRTILWEKFDRMLFLTATPFQLGHYELIRILYSFTSAYWKRDRAPVKTREEFHKSLDELSKRLDLNRQYGKRIDELWGRHLKQEQFGMGLTDQQLESEVVKWWERIEQAPNDSMEQSLVQAVNDCILSRNLAENDMDNAWQSLRAWVIRHNRSVTLPSFGGQSNVFRREKRIGAAIICGTSGSDKGLPLSRGTALPFLLAVRAQGELAGSSSTARAFFAEGLCSSYEAFHHTRDNRGDIRDVNDEGDEQQLGKHKKNAIKSLVPVEWYEKQVAALIPSLSESQELRYNHPKIRPVVECAVNLWEKGEKVLIFCFYRQTATALRVHLKQKIEDRIFSLIAKKINIKNDETVKQKLSRIIRRLSDQGVFHDELVKFFSGMLDLSEYAILKPKRERILEMLLAYFRSPAFLSRYIPFELKEVQEAFEDKQRDQAILRKGAVALINAIETAADDSNTTTKSRIQQFLDFAKELAERSRTQGDVEVGQSEIKSLLDQYLDAVAVYSSPRHSQLDDDQDEKKMSDEGSYRVLPVVRMVFGDTHQDVRQRLMSAFNSPLFPEILVSSAVLGEGVDLHRFCRYVIHHDLCWNPSTLEQRTGRLDRICCKAEYAQQSIVIYEPYVAGSADEKMFRVVQDRERWFQVVMGQKFEFNEAASEKIAKRVPLPRELARKLIFDLSVWQSKDE